MKETVKTAGFLQTEVASVKMGAVLRQVGVAVLGFFMARTGIVGGMTPLGAALASGVPMKYIFSALLGSVIGYFVPIDGAPTLKYTAGLLAIGAIRLILSSLKGVSKSAVWSGIIAFTVVSSLGFASVGFRFDQTGLLSLTEGVFAGLGAYFFRKATDLRLNTGATIEQTASLLLSVCLCLVSLMPINLAGVSIGRILASLLILYAAKYGRVGASAICGIASAGAVCLGMGDTTVALFFCFSGVIAGIFAPINRLMTAVMPIVGALVWLIVTSASKISAQVLVEASVAAIIFGIVPKTVTAHFGTLIAPPTVTPDTKGLRRTLTMRLGFAASALYGVSETVEDVARCLAISKKPAFSNVLHSVEGDACKGCSFCTHCWDKNRKTTVDAVLGMSDAIRKCRPIGLAQVPDEFREKCLRIERFEDSVTKHYSDFLSSISAEKRVAEMRELVADQMNGVADMLNELSDEFQTAQMYNIELAGRVSAALRELDLRADECSCVVDKFGRMTVELRLLNTPEMPINRAKILEKIETVCERDFEPPEVNRVGRTYYITVTEKAVYSVDCGLTQFNQGKNQYCGDACRHFFDGRGRLVAIVSDGMGSGGRAAVDSAMTSALAERLIKAGFGFDCTLRLVNSAMLFKSTDESLSTLDISCIDLYTGKTELLKAGAAPTIVRRSGRTGRAECKSLPAGILREVGFDRATVTLDEGDILVMISDGVCNDGTDWICAEVEAWRDGDAKQLSERLATAARRRRHDGHEDDITVFTAILEKAI